MCTDIASSVSTASLSTMSSSSSSSSAGAQPRRRFQPRHYISLAISILLYVHGSVPHIHLIFALFSIPYTFFLSKAIFPVLSIPRGPPIFSNLDPYILLAAVIGLFLPIAYIAEATYVGDTWRVDAAGPHLFLLCAQVFMEGLAFSEAMAMPLQVFVPVYFNAGRLPVLWDWLGKEMATVEGRGDATWRVLAGRAFAAINMGFWCFNLFGFLLPLFLPRVFRRYYSAKEEGRM